MNKPMEVENTDISAYAPTQLAKTRFPVQLNRLCEDIQFV